MSSALIFQKLGIALLLGLLIGLQREKVQSRIAGLRTFPIITVFGALCALLGQNFGSAIPVAGIISVAALAIFGNGIATRDGGGITTEISLLVMYAVGAYLIVGTEIIAIAVAGTLAVLLQFKPELHKFVSKLGEDDLRALMRLVILAFIILPLLPNKTMGPFEVINPREIWFVVVIVVGLNLTGYIIYKFVGRNTGTLLSGVLGGLISSTATTVSTSRLAKKSEKFVPRAATIILVASTLAHVRVMGLLGGTSPQLLRAALVPLGIILGVSIVLCAGCILLIRKDQHKIPDPERPGDVRTALVFGATYAAVVLIVAAAKKYLGDSSLYWVAGVSGLTDVDAITLSTGKLVSNGRLDASQGKDMIVIAVLSNLVFKAGIVAVMGNRKLLLWVGGLFGICVGVGIATLLLL